MLLGRELVRQEFFASSELLLLSLEAHKDRKALAVSRSSEAVPLSTFLHLLLADFLELHFLHLDSLSGLHYPVELLGSVLSLFSESPLLLIFNEG